MQQSSRAAPDIFDFLGPSTLGAVVIFLRIGGAPVLSDLGSFARVAQSPAAPPRGRPRHELIFRCAASTATTTGRLVVRRARRLDGRIALMFGQRRTSQPASSFRMSAKTTGEWPPGVDRICIDSVYLIG